MLHAGDRVVLDDDELGVVVSADDDGAVCIRTSRGLVLSCALDDEEAWPHDFARAKKD